MSKLKSAVLGVAGAATLLAGLPLAMQAVNAGVNDTPPVSFLETFTGAPATPTAWTSANWDLTVHSRDVGTWGDNDLEPMMAGHAMDCAGGNANSHPTNSYAGAIFQCRDHVMTALKAEGYGVAYMTPNNMLDFSGGEAVIKFDISTLRASTRDFWDVWVTPYDSNLQLAGESWYPDLDGLPKNAVHIGSDAGNVMFGQVVRDHQIVQWPDFPSNNVTGDWWTGYQSFLTPDSARRDTVEIRISRTHIKIGMPQYNFYWVDADIPALPFDQGVVQFGHHSYNPEKACDWDGSCHAGTWHWDNVSLSPSKPFTMVKSNLRTVTGTAGTTTETLAAPAPANANLRFTAIGPNMQVSYDNGATWINAVRADAGKAYAEEHWTSYWMPIPAGITSVMFRGGQPFWGGSWWARDVSVWSPNAPGAGTAPATTAPATTAPATTAPATTSPSPTNAQNSAGARFTTLPAGTALPSDADCASRVRPAAEIRPGNTPFNSVRGTRANTTYPRVTGNFTGTTDEIIQWTACKWGIDEDVVRSQTAMESYWTQTARGDMTSDQTACHPDLRTTNGSQCPESVGSLQVRYAYHGSAFVDKNAINSTAYNLDYAYAVWRDCFDGGMGWLNTTDRGSEYAAGDQWGCLGVWFSGRWHTAAAEGYITQVRSYFDQKIWTAPGFISWVDPNAGSTPTTTPTTSPATTAPATTAPATPTTTPATAPATTAPGTPSNSNGTWQNISPPINLSLFGADQFGFQTIGLSPANPNIVYVGTSYEGIWKTTNQGGSWSRVSTGANGANLATGRNWTLAVDPTNANILYTVAGYGANQGIWKSTNGGVDWAQMLPQSVMSTATADIYSIAIDPTDSRHLIAGSHSGWNFGADAGVLESKDGGATWILHNPQGGWGRGHYVFFINSTTWLLGTQDAGFYRTTNSGASWTKVSNENLQHGGGQLYRASTGVLYTGALHTMLRSTDNGASWTPVGPTTQDGFNGIIGDGTTLYAQRANTGFATTGDQSYVVSPETDGITWTQQNNGAQKFADGPLNMVFDPTNRIIYSTNWRAGVWKLNVGGTPSQPPTTTPTTTPVTTPPTVPVTTVPVTTPPTVPVTTVPVTTVPVTMPPTTVPVPPTTVPVTTVPPSVTTANVPTNVVAKATATRTIKVTWTAVPGRTYEIIYSRVGRTGSRVVRNVTAGSYTFTRLTNGATYVFQVREKVGTSTSAWSAPVSVKATSRIV